MDDVEIEDVNEDGSPYRVERGPIKNQDLSSLSQDVGDFLALYGWHLMVATVIAFVLIQYLNKKRASQRRHRPVSPTSEDPDLVVRRQEAVDAARRKMQEELDAKAAVFKEKQKQQEEEKRRQKIEMYESLQQGKSYKASAKLSQPTEEASTSSTVLKPNTDRKNLRSSDYNPLSGQGGSSCSWRPGRRGPSSGGG
ncbi:selenoprotein S [Parambassis ranga]|uniref:Selenoprotein S n=1 Tax=Parambassis ranga TaxID=210632 RepID=A0A6P7HVW6_9TELE|nr:selenoprotein S [Parambassis ranga]